MGTVIEVKKQSFRIRAERIPEAMEVFRTFRAAHPAKAGVGSGVGYDFMGIPNQELDECDTIQEVLHEFGWDAVVDPGSGDITGLEYMVDKLLDEERLFAAISPVVEKGSFVQVKSDGGGRWRWSFDGKHCSAPLEAGRQMVRERIRAGERQLGG